MATRSHFVLSLRNITLQRDANTILKDVSWDIARGEHWVVLGANGSGKTSLMLIAALYLHPSAGEVVVEGERLGDTGVRELRQRIAYNSAAFASEIRPQLLAYEVVMTAKNAALETWWHQYEATDKAKAIHCLSQLGVGHLAEREISTLSSGEQQRVFLARTRMNEPSLVLLDEPSAALAPQVVLDIFRAVARICRDGMTLLLVEQNVRMALLLADYGYVIKDGVIHIEGAAESLINDDAIRLSYLGGTVADRDQKLSM